MKPKTKPFLKPSKRGAKLADASKMVTLLRNFKVIAHKLPMAEANKNTAIYQAKTSVSEFLHNIAYDINAS